MTTFDRFERELPEILEELYLGPTPDYRDDLLGRIAGTRQRPGWALSERWLPMDAISQRSTFMPPLPWRTIGAVALLILGLVVGVMLIAGGQRTRLPEPFGPAANGLIAFAANGDLFTVDPATGRTRALTTGPDTDRNPVWSRDGTRIVFERRVSGVQGVRLYIVRADGTDVRAIIPEPLAGFRSYVFSPDSREVLFDPEPGSESAFGVARVDGGGVRTIDVGMPAVDPAFRPPDGAEILFLGFPTWDREVAGVYVANADGSRRRTLVEPSRSRTVEAARWSPDGSRIAYSAADFTVQDWTVQVHVLDIDGSDDHTIPAPAGARWSGQAEWSNDGTRLAMYRGYSIRDDSDITIAVVPADGSGPGVQTDRSGLTGTPVYEWAPDDTSVLLMPPDWVLSGPFAPLVMDPRTGATQPADFESDSPPSMQRLAVEP